MVPLALAACLLALWPMVLQQRQLAFYLQWRDWLWTAHML